MSYRRAHGSWALSMLLGCGPAVDGEGDDGGPGSSGDGDASTSQGTAMPGTSANPSTTTLDDSSSATAVSGSDDSSDDGTCTDACGCSFFPECGDVAGGPECDLYAQDCPSDQKCMPWADDGGELWNAVHCAPRHPEPQAIGGPCTAEGSYVSGVDDCPLGSMCFWVDTTTDEGTCVAMCGGSQAGPECDAGTTCVIDFNETITLCLPPCDPLVQDCVEGAACHRSDLFGYTCGDVIEPAVAVGQPCTHDWQCSTGTLCLSDDALVGCAGESCCTPFCQLGTPDVCGDGEVCQPVYPGVPDLVHPDVGYCGVAK